MSNRDDDDSTGLTLPTTESRLSGWQRQSASSLSQHSWQRLRLVRYTLRRRSVREAFRVQQAHREYLARLVRLAPQVRLERQEQLDPQEQTVRQEREARQEQ